MTMDIQTDDDFVRLLKDLRSASESDAANHMAAAMNAKSWLADQSRAHAGKLPPEFRQQLDDVRAALLPLFRTCERAGDAIAVFYRTLTSGWGVKLSGDEISAVLNHAKNATGTSRDLVLGEFLQVLRHRSADLSEAHLVTLAAMAGEGCGMAMNVLRTALAGAGGGPGPSGTEARKTLAHPPSKARGKGHN